MAKNRRELDITVQGRTIKWHRILDEFFFWLIRILVELDITMEGTTIKWHRILEGKYHVRGSTLFLFSKRPLAF